VIFGDSKGTGGKRLTIMTVAFSALDSLKVVPSRRSKLFLHPEILTEQSVGQLKSKNHKKRVGQRRKFQTRYIRSLHWSNEKNVKLGVLYVFFQYLIRAELYSDYEKLG